MKKSFLLLAIIAFFGQVSAQEVQPTTQEFKLHKKGEFYVYWGYNRSWFANSDIHFYGQGHDFVLHNVKGSDRPSPVNWDYIKPQWWSTPQFNIRGGYFISDKFAVSLGWDHMKWVIDEGQYVNMTGYIDPTNVEDPAVKAAMEAVNAQNGGGTYNGTPMLISKKDNPNFINGYEHTDGLNYVSADIESYDKLWQCKKYNKLGLSSVVGLGLGTIIPRTDCHLFTSGQNHFWNISGWGASAKVGLKLNLTKRIYLQSDFKYGYLDLLNIHTTSHHSIDKATQKIVFFENYWVVGFRI